MQNLSDIYSDLILFKNYLKILNTSGSPLRQFPHHMDPAFSEAPYFLDRRSKTSNPLCGSPGSPRTSPRASGSGDGSSESFRHY